MAGGARDRRGRGGRWHPAKASPSPEAVDGDGTDIETTRARMRRPVQRWPELLRARQRAVAGVRYRETERVR